MSGTVSTEWSLPQPTEFSHFPINIWVNGGVFAAITLRMFTRMAFREVEILLVEDNPDDEFLIVRALRKHDVSNRIHVARDGDEALDFLFCRGRYEGRDCDQLLKLVLLDVKLPGMSGLEVLAQIRQNEFTCGIPVVLLTSSAIHEEMLKAYVQGANSFLQKPVDFDSFDELIKHVGYYWLRLNKNPDKLTLVADVEDDPKKDLVTLTA